MIKILHVVPHLGGGVGRALSAIVEYDDVEVSRSFLLLDLPRETYYIRSIEDRGGKVYFVSDVDDRLLIKAADIVQIEWWNHPLVFEWLCHHGSSEMRTVFWSHISGLNYPYIPDVLFSVADCVLYSSPCSLMNSNARYGEHCEVGVINSGFGFLGDKKRLYSEKPRIGYLGTVSFEKMHPSFFECIDLVQSDDFTVNIFGDVKEDVKNKVRAMKYPEKVCLRGFTTDSKGELSRLDVFLYLLRRDHYGTGENALMEAMSLGCVPIVLDNPAEMQIVQDGITGYVARDIQDAVDVLHMLLANPSCIEEVGRRAMSMAMRAGDPRASCEGLKNMYLKVLRNPKKTVEYSEYLGDSPASWLELTYGDGSRCQYVKGGEMEWCQARFRSYYPSCFMS